MVKAIAPPVVRPKRARIACAWQTRPVATGVCRVAPARRPMRKIWCAAIRRTRSVVPIGVVADLPSRLNAASLEPLNPLAPPGWRLEGIREILCLVHNLTVAEFHNTHGVCRSPLVGDCVFRDPEIAFSENSLDVKTRRLAWMMTP